MPNSPAPADEAIERLLGATVAGKYRIDRLLGQGGMGAVFQATNTVIGKRVALKFLSDEASRDAQAAQRFLREAEAAGLVESEHIVQIFDFGETERGQPFLVMELLTGQDLRGRLNAEPKLPLEEAAGVARQVLRALVRAHAAGIVHRDLKPDNVFLCARESGEPLVKLVDFGISKLSRKTTLDTLTRRGTILGTAYYMSPEQAQGLEEVDPRTDLYSVGAIVYEMLAGRPPHVAPTYEAILVAICTRDADDVRMHAPQVSEAMARVLRRALARDREQRYASASEMLTSLENALAGKLEPLPEGSAGLAVPVRPSLNSTSLSRRRTYVAAIVALLFGFAATAILLSRGRHEPMAEPLSPTPAPPSAANAVVDVAAPIVEPVASIAALSSASASPARPAGSATPAKHPTPAAVKSEKPRPKVGVAHGLELNTEGP